MESNDFGVATVERGVMAKAKRGKPDPEPETPRTLFSIKGLPSWHEWLKEYANSLGVSATTAIDIALREQAKRDGFGKPMPKRFP